MAWAFGGGRGDARDLCQPAQRDRQARDAGCRYQPLIVSRSDSKLRGHYPTETDVIADVLGPFDAHFVPAFFEGGRITRGGTHYLMVDGEPVLVHETEFARDSVFGSARPTCRTMSRKRPSGGFRRKR